MRELLYALRRLRGSPMFTIAATLTMAIAIGATASVFSLVDGVLLKGFPFRDPSRVLEVYESNPGQRVPKDDVAPANYLDWRAQNSAFTALAAAEFTQFTVIGKGEPERVWGLAVTPSYFTVLGATPVLGRALAPDSSGPPEVVISYDYWQRRFGGAPSVIGQTLTLGTPMLHGLTVSIAPSNRPYTIVGVMPAGMIAAGGPAGDTQLWARLSFTAADQLDRFGHPLVVYGRLTPGVTRESAQSDMEMIAHRLAQRYPSTNEGGSVVTVPLLDQLVGPVRPALLILLSAAGCVLLIGAANLANLFLVRCLAREREMAVRTALGATRTRLVRELVIEAATLGLGGGALGVGLAVAGVRVLRDLAPRTLPRLSELGMDGRVVAFGVLSSIATVLLFGVLPAWQVSRSSLAEFLKDGGRSSGSREQHRLQNGLVVLQVVVAVVLLSGAGLLVESFEHFERIDPGFRPDGVLTAQIDLPRERYPTPQRQAAFIARVVERLGAVPGVKAASASDAVPARIGAGVSPFLIIGGPALDPVHAPIAFTIGVTPDYFHTLGIKLLRGRGVLPTDDMRAVKVAVVDERLARRYFGTRDPLGQRLRFFGPDAVEIVGVVTSVKQWGLAASDLAAIYMPLLQFGTELAYVEVRASGDPARETGALKQAIAGLDPTVPVSDVKTMAQRVTDSVGTTRFSSVLASLFALVSLLLGVVGIYSVLAYVVRLRQREIGVRLALGASSARLIGAVLRQGLLLAGTGILLGSGTAWALTTLLTRLFGSGSSYDPGFTDQGWFLMPTLIGSAAVFAVVALAAASVPAFRTTRINPVVVLTSA